MNPNTIQIIMIVVLFAVMYFLLIRPQKKQEKELSNMRANLKVGDDIVTIGGICGKIVRVKENRLTIQVGADKTKFDIEKWAVSRLDDGKKDSAVKTSKDEEEKKVTPKRMKKLGKKDEAEKAEEAAPAPTEAVAEEK